MATQKTTAGSKKSRRPKSPPAKSLTGEAIEAANQQALAVQLRLAGATMDEIASRLGLSSRKVARNILQKTLSDTIGEIRQNADAYVAEEALRLERLIRAVWPLALGKPERVDPNTGRRQAEVPPDLKAVDRMLRLMERKARLLGLDEGIGRGEGSADDADQKDRPDERSLLAEKLARVLVSAQEKADDAGRGEDGDADGNRSLH